MLLFAVSPSPGCGSANTGETDAGTADGQCDEPFLVYIHHQAGMYTPGAVDDPVANVSSQIGFPEWVEGCACSPQSWEFLTECVREAVAPFNIEVVEEDPGNVPHGEIMFALESGAVSGMSNLEHVVPQRCGGTPEPFIAFAFSTSITLDNLCYNAVASLGHVIGLSNSPVCEDMMATSWGSCTRGFLDEELPCGQYSTEELCVCTDRATQNSFDAMARAYGLRCQ